MSDQEPSLQDILSDKVEVSAPVEKETKVETTTDAKAATSAAEQTTETTETKAEKAAQSRDESGKFAKAEEKPAQQQTEKPRPDIAAIIDERRKRQALEKQIAELQAQKPAAKVSVFDNEDEAIRVRVDEATRPLREAHYNLSMRYARQLHGDTFSSAEEAFMNAAEANPALYEGLRAASDPGEYVYLHGTFHKEMSEVGGDILKYRDKVTSDSASKLSAAAAEIATLKAQVEALTKSKTELEQIPTSLNGRASASPAVGDVSEEEISQIVRFGSNKR